jgi:hypothetical protein
MYKQYTYYIRSNKNEKATYLDYAFTTVSHLQTHDFSQTESCLRVGSCQIWFGQVWLCSQGAPASFLKHDLLKHDVVSHCQEEPCSRHIFLFLFASQWFDLTTCKFDSSLFLHIK